MGRYKKKLVPRNAKPQCTLQYDVPRIKKDNTEVECMIGDKKQGRECEERE